jgi:GNAT superfamily N-acetyltransferase
VTPAELTAARVRAAHADAAGLEGRLRVGLRGGAVQLPGIHLMASGLPRPQWNNADVVGPGAPDEVVMAQVRAWFAERHVPWGVRVPEGQPWPYGRKLLTKRVMATELDRPPDPMLDIAEPEDVEIRVAVAADLTTYARVDAAAFDDEVAPTADYARPMLGAAGFHALLAFHGGQPAGVAHAIRSDGAGGPSVGIFGVGVLAAHRRLGIGRSLTTHLLRWGGDSGADLAWLNPDDDAAAALYAGLGFREVPGFDVYVDA